MSKLSTTSEGRAGDVRRFVLNTLGNRFATDQAQRDRLLLAAVRNRNPKVLEELGEATILALTRTLTSGVCGWCAAAQIAGHDLEATPTRRAALGSMCDPCQRRRDKAESTDAERDHLREISEAGSAWPLPAGCAPARRSSGTPLRSRGCGRPRRRWHRPACSGPGASSRPRSPAP